MRLLHSPSSRETRFPVVRILARIALIIGGLFLFSGGSAEESSAPLFDISDLGQFPVNFEEYGNFTDAGTPKFKYKIIDRNGLAEAMGTALYPNGSSSLDIDRSFKRWSEENDISKVNPWDFIQTGDPQKEFYVWARTNNVSPGTKLFFMAQALADSNQLTHALKAYHAIVVNFPREICWTADRSYYWYPAKEALSRIESIITLDPRIGYRLHGASYKLDDQSDNDPQNDVVLVNPGKWIPYTQVTAVDLEEEGVEIQRGSGRVHLIQYTNKHWQLLVDEQPFFIRGITYHPTKVGSDLSDIHANSWMFDDANNNGKADAPYDSWVDKNKNNIQDPDEVVKGDFQLLKEMGVNTIRLYRHSRALDYEKKEFNKEVLRDLYKKYGIMVALGDFLGAYGVSSGASSTEGTDYTDGVQKSRMKRIIRDYVNDHKKEPYVLLWILGNENLMKGDYSGVNATMTKASTQVPAYLKFVNEMADFIHQLDPDHPVAVGNMDVINLEEHRKYAPSVDIFGANSYRGISGFGNLWSQVQTEYDRPVLITEYGCDDFNSKTQKEDEAMQLKYHMMSWKDIYAHRAGGPQEGNAIGGIAFEFLDEWWKSPNSAYHHEATNDSPMAFPDGWSSEEYLGIAAQGDGKASPFIRQLRKAYTLYKDDLWKEKNSTANR